MSELEQSEPAVFYDATLRFQVQSDSDPHVKYMVELDSYFGNGECDCPSFVFRPRGMEFSKRDLCAKRVPPHQAITAGWVKMPKSGRVSDALRCKHIVNARDELATAVIKSLVYAEKAKR